jgi:hypothetical protein
MHTNTTPTSESTTPSTATPSSTTSMAARAAAIIAVSLACYVTAQHPAPRSDKSNSPTGSSQQRS